MDNDVTAMGNVLVIPCPTCGCLLEIPMGTRTDVERFNRSGRVSAWCPRRRYLYDDEYGYVEWHE